MYRFNIQVSSLFTTKPKSLRTILPVKMQKTASVDLN